MDNLSENATNGLMTDDGQASWSWGRIDQQSLEDSNFLSCLLKNIFNLVHVIFFLIVTGAYNLVTMDLNARCWKTW